MQKICVQCRQRFEITDDDLAFYEKISPVFAGKKELIPPPTHCPPCRRQRRHTHRNERNLYHRKSDLTGKQILSIFAPASPAIVYGHREWWSDAWDPLEYGRNFDFSRPFFEQFGELLRAVPHMNVALINVENCDYCHLMGDSKNCYLVFETSHAQDCLHGYWLQKCEDCCDVSFSHECSRCFDIDNCYVCQNLRWSRNCTNCSDSAFLLDCIGCRNCIFCVNMRQKEYCIFNEQYTKEEYETKLREHHFGSAKGIAVMEQRFHEFALKHPRKYMTAVQEENCTGNYIQESKNCIECFHAHQAEDCMYGEHVWRGVKDCRDIVTAGRGAELLYETTNTNMGAARDAFAIQCWSSRDVLYSSECYSCMHCFGCVCLKRKQYCIFNKQYTKEEYETLVPKIIEHMRNDGGAMNPSGASGSWGEFFPPSISLFGYNESVAQEYFSLTKKEAIAHGWQWREEEDRGQQYLGPEYAIEDDVANVPDDITTKILLCEATGKPYKIIPQELRFCREMNVPIPRLSPDERHRRRMALRNPLQLWKRACAKCKKSIATSFAPDRPEIVYCETCYLQEVY